MYFFKCLPFFVRNLTSRGRQKPLMFPNSDSVMLALNLKVYRMLSKCVQFEKVNCVVNECRIWNSCFNITDSREIVFVRKLISIKRQLWSYINGAFSPCYFPGNVNGTTT